jgi:hypothetical protein
MDRQAALQYHKTLSELLGELQQATTTELRAPIVSRMHNILFPMHVIDTYAAQHTHEALSKLKHPDVALVQAAQQTIADALKRFQATIAAHPDEPFVIYGENERYFVKPVAHEELASLRTHSRLLGPNHEHYVMALEATPQLERVFRAIDKETLAPALTRLGFPHVDALAFFKTRAHPKLGKPAEKMPSVRVCTMRGGVPVTLVSEHVF